MLMSHEELSLVEIRRSHKLPHFTASVKKKTKRYEKKAVLNPFKYAFFGVERKTVYFSDMRRAPEPC